MNGEDNSPFKESVFADRIVLLKCSTKTWTWKEDKVWKIKTSSYGINFYNKVSEYEFITCDNQKSFSAPNFFFEFREWFYMGQAHLHYDDFRKTFVPSSPPSYLPIFPAWFDFLFSSNRCEQFKVWHTFVSCKESVPFSVLSDGGSMWDATLLMFKNSFHDGRLGNCVYVADHLKPPSHNNGWLLRFQTKKQKWKFGWVKTRNFPAHLQFTFWSTFFYKNDKKIFPTLN